MAGYAGGLFIPFRDATNGTETYGAGRYLVDAAKSADLGGDPATGTLIIDFNFAYPAVVRVRPTLGVSAGATGEPPRPPDPCRASAWLTTHTDLA